MKKRSFRGPFARWPKASDAVLAVALFLVTASWADASAFRPMYQVAPLILALYAVTAATFYVRRRLPVVVLGVTVVSWAVILPFATSDLGLMAIFALYSVGRYAPRSRSGQIGVVAAIAMLVVDGIVRPTPWSGTSFGVVLFFAVWYVGRRLRLRVERAIEQRLEQEAEARRIVTEERTHIARELHDMVAHQVSMMTVQAGAAQAVADVDPEGARQAMAAVEQAGREALDELRHLLGVLRPESERGGLGPQPGLADLARLVAQVTKAGLDIRVTDGVRSPLPTRVQLSAYRIIQEALTNVLKHSGPSARAEVHLRDDGTDLTIEVFDHAPPGHHAPAPLARSQAPGHGIIGMRERATLLGGSLEAGPRPDGGFRVVARLPLTGETA